MPLISNTVTVPANGVIANVLAGSQYEYLQFNAFIEIGLLQQAVTYGDVQATVMSGTDVLMEEGAIPQRAGAPVYPDDFQLSDEAAAGDRLTIRLRNTQGTTRLVAYSIKLTPI